MTDKDLKLFFLFSLWMTKRFMSSMNIEFTNNTILLTIHDMVTPTSLTMTNDCRNGMFSGCNKREFCTVIKQSSSSVVASQ